MNERHSVDTVVCVLPSQCMRRNLFEYWWHTQPGFRVAHVKAIRIRERRAYEFVYIHMDCVGASKLTFHLCKCVRIRTLPNVTRSMCACNARTCACFVLWIKIWLQEKWKLLENEVTAHADFVLSVWHRQTSSESYTILDFAFGIQCISRCVTDAIIM